MDRQHGVLSFCAGVALAALVSAQSPLRYLAGPDFNGSFGAAADGGHDVNGDGVADVVAGAPGAAPGSTGSGTGTARVYSGADGRELCAWVAEASGDGFGTAVALVADVDGDGRADVLVGAPRHDAGGTQAGRVYLYSGASGALLATLDGDNVLDLFGSAVAGLGDLDGDGRGDVLVGAPGHDNIRTDDGRVSVYSGGALAAGAGPGALITTHIPTYAFPGCCARLGSAVTGCGDVDADGTPDYAAGAPTDWVGSPAFHRGSVSVFSGRTHARIGFFAASGNWDALGTAVGDAGDVNNDGYADVIAGATTCTSGNPNLPFVDVYSGAAMAGAGGPAILHRLTAPALGLCSGFGASVAGIGDIDGDGGDDVVVGAPLDGSVSIQRGSVHVFSGTTGSLLFRVGGVDPSERLGAAVCAAGDVNGDGTPDFATGAPSARDLAARSNGELRMFSGRPIAYPSADVRIIGSGCGGAGTPPSLSATPPVLDSLFTIDLAGAAGSQVGALLISAPTSSFLPLGMGCTLYVDQPTSVAVPFAADRAGAFGLPIPLTFDWTLAGVQVHLQSVLAGGSGALGLDFTNGVRLTIGV